MLKILQARFQQYVNWELADVQAGFRKGKGTRDQIANIHWIIEKEREFQKNIYFCFIDYTKASACADHNRIWKFLKVGEYQTTLPVSWETCTQVKRQQLELDMEQQFGLVPNWERSMSRYILSPCLFKLYAEYLRWNAGLDEAQAGIKIARKIKITSDMQMTPPLWQKVKRN